jgi:hypothetical protein
VCALREFDATDRIANNILVQTPSQTGFLKAGEPALINVLPGDVQKLYDLGGKDDMLFIEINWIPPSEVLTGKSPGKSSSRRFAVVASNQEGADRGFNQPSSEINTNTLPVESEQPPGSDGTSDDTPGAGPATTSLVNGGPMVSASGQPTTTPGANDNAQVSGGSGTGGLSTGAIAGIAVACGVIGLALIGALAWFLIRRRRQRPSRDSLAATYGNGAPHTDLVAEKEAGAAAAGGADPHSPYSEEGAVAGASESGPLHAQHQSTRAEREFSPYTDAAPPPAAAAVGTAPGARDSVATNGERAGAPSQMSGRYAHLIEEGMTADEIARMEEEERHLDAAIERAGRT